MPDWRLTADQAWASLQPLVRGGRSFTCGYCANQVASSSGLQTEHYAAAVLVCPHCNGPTFFGSDGSQWPGPKVGSTITHLAPDVEAIYEQARSSIAANAYTGSVMLCRKLLMHVAVEKGAKEDLSFQKYAEYLVSEHYAPRGADVWLDYIRRRGNEANHELVIMNNEDAIGVLKFTEMLLRSVYELPALVPLPPASP